jgi:hypothetical protein
MADMDSRAIRAAICTSALMAFSLSSANAQLVQLRISVSGPDSQNTAPQVRISSGALEKPIYDMPSRTWRVPLRRDQGGFLSAFRFWLPQADEVIPVQLNIPVSMIEKDPIVYLSAPSSYKFDDPAVRAFWGNSERASNHDPQVQFRYLHDLMYVNKSIQAAAGPNVNLTATSTIAAFMLLQTIDSLRQRTWYVMSPEAQEIVSKAIKTLYIAIDQKKICRWLKNKACDLTKKDIKSLVERVNSIDSFHLNKIYMLIYPKNTTPSLSFCNSKVKQVSAFMNYIASDPDVSGPLPSRVAQELAACHATLALCQKETPPLEYSISQLDAAEAVLLRAKSNQNSWKNRLIEVQQARSQVQKGGQAICPSEERKA